MARVELTAFQSLPQEFQSAKPGRPKEEPQRRENPLFPSPVADPAPATEPVRTPQPAAPRPKREPVPVG